MGKKKGKACKPISPIKPDVAEEADLADPGKMADIIAEQLKNKTGKYGSTPAKPFKPPTEEEQEEKKEEPSWIAIKMEDREGQPIPGTKYKIILPDGETSLEGTLDGEGKARVDGIDPGGCKIIFPELDKDAWKRK